MDDWPKFRLDDLKLSVDADGLAQVIGARQYSSRGSSVPAKERTFGGCGCNPQCDCDPLCRCDNHYSCDSECNHCRCVSQDCDCHSVCGCYDDPKCGCAYVQNSGVCTCDPYN